MTEELKSLGQIKITSTHCDWFLVKRFLSTYMNMEDSQTDQIPQYLHITSMNSGESKK